MKKTLKQLLGHPKDKTEFREYILLKAEELSEHATMNIFLIQNIIGLRNQVWFVIL